MASLNRIGNGPGVVSPILDGFVGMTELQTLRPAGSPLLALPTYPVLSMTHDEKRLMAIRICLWDSVKLAGSIAVHSNQ